LSSRFAPMRGKPRLWVVTMGLPSDEIAGNGSDDRVFNP
jgi:hypothetical protein